MKTFAQMDQQAARERAAREFLAVGTDVLVNGAEAGVVTEAETITLLTGLAANSYLVRLADGTEEGFTQGYLTEVGMDITITQDALGRATLLIGEQQAAELIAWRRANWTEVAGCGWGSTVRVSVYEGGVGAKLAALYEAAEASGERYVLIGGAFGDDGLLKADSVLATSGVSRDDGGFYLAG